MNFGLKKKKEGPEKPDPVSIAALVEAIPEKQTTPALPELSDKDILGDISIHCSDITSHFGYRDWEWNVIVVPQYPDKACTVGVSGALKDKKGIKAYDKFVKANGPLEHGTAIATTANPGSDIIFIHVASLDAGREKDFAVVEECVFNALQLVQEVNLSINHMAFPAFNVNTLGTLTYAQSAQATLKAIARNKKMCSGKAPPISLVLHNIWVQSEFRDVLKNRSYINADINQPGEHDPNEGFCLGIKRPDRPQFLRPKSGGDEPGMI